MEKTSGLQWLLAIFNDAGYDFKNDFDGVFYRNFDDLFGLEKLKSFHC